MLTEQDIETLRKLEEDMWREETRFDIPYMERLLAEDFTEIGRSGKTYGRAACLAIPRQAIGALIPLPNFAIRPISETVVLVTYDSQESTGGEVQHAHRSSIWTRHLEGWQLRFHQGTPFAPEDG